MSGDTTDSKAPFTPTDDLTRLIVDASATGEANPAQSALIDRVYARLRAMAARESRHSASETLRPTALANEAYMRLFGRGAQQFENRAHFFGAAATVMRQIMVDRARRQRAQKRGGGWDRTTLTGLTGRHDDDPQSMIDLDGALAKLAELSPRQAQVVELRFFAEMTVEEVAAALSVSPRTIELDWRTARAFLLRVMDATDD